MTRAPSISRHAWLVVALLVPVALLNYLDRQMLASMKFSVMRDVPDIALEANWGAMLGARSSGSTRCSARSAATSPIATRRRHVIAGSLFVWSLVTWTTGHVTTYDELLATRALMGDQRGVLHSRGAGADRRLPPRPDAVARRRPPSDGDLSAA